MRELMVRAHQLAKEMEGHYHARMALALRMAWAERRQPRAVRLEVRHQPSGGREWVARLVGFDLRYRYAREFLAPVDRRWSQSGRTGVTVFELEPGHVYEVCEPYRGRRFVAVRGCQAVAMTEDDVQAFLRSMVHDAA